MTESLDQLNRKIGFYLGKSALPEEEVDNYLVGFPYSLNHLSNLKEVLKGLDDDFLLNIDSLRTLKEYFFSTIQNFSVLELLKNHRKVIACLKQYRQHNQDNKEMFMHALQSSIEYMQGNMLEDYITYITQLKLRELSALLEFLSVLKGANYSIVEEDLIKIKQLPTVKILLKIFNLLNLREQEQSVRCRLIPILLDAANLKDIELICSLQELSIERKLTILQKNPRMISAMARQIENYQNEFYAPAPVLQEKIEVITAPKENTKLAPRRNDTDPTPIPLRSKSRMDFYQQTKEIIRSQSPTQEILPGTPHPEIRSEIKPWQYPKSRMQSPYRHNTDPTSASSSSTPFFTHSNRNIHEENPVKPLCIIKR